MMVLRNGSSVGRVILAAISLALATAGASATPNIPPPGLHAAECDAAISHRQPGALTPLEDIELTVTVDTDMLDVDTVVLAYTVNGGAAQAVTTSGTGASSYTLTVSGLTLPEGAIIDYNFAVHGVFLVEDCADYDWAVAPTYLRYHTIATSDQSASNRGLYDSVSQAAYVALAQSPSEVAETTPESVCESFFTSPTPCELLPAVDETLAEAPSEQTPTKTAIYDQSVPPKIVGYIYSGQGYRDFPTVRTTFDSLGTASAPHEYATGTNAIYQSASATRRLLVGFSEAEVVGLVGYEIDFTGAHPPEGENVLRVAITAAPHVHGQMTATTTSVPCRVGSQSLPCSLGNVNLIDVRSTAQGQASLVYKQSSPTTGTFVTAVPPTAFPLQQGDVSAAHQHQGTMLTEGPPPKEQNIAAPKSWEMTVAPDTKYLVLLRLWDYAKAEIPEVSAFGIADAFANHRLTQTPPLRAEMTSVRVELMDGAYFD